MQVKLYGIFSITVGNSTVIASLGESEQNYPILAGYHDVAIAPVLSDNVRLNEDEDGVIITGNKFLLMTASPTFHRVEIVPLTQNDAQAFFTALQSDPDVKSAGEQLLTAYQAYSAAFFADVEKVLDQLPDDGPTATLVGYLENANWSDAFIEVARAIKLALPEKWEAITKLINPAGLAWLSKKME